MKDLNETWTSAAERKILRGQWFVTCSPLNPSIAISMLFVSLTHRLTDSTAHWPANAVSTFCSVSRANYAYCYHNQNSLSYFRIWVILLIITLNLFQIKNKSVINATFYLQPPGIELVILQLTTLAQSAAPASPVVRHRSNHRYHCRDAIVLPIKRPRALLPRCDPEVSTSVRHKHTQT